MEIVKVPHESSPIYFGEDWKHFWGNTAYNLANYSTWQRVRVLLVAGDDRKSVLVVVQ